MPRIDYDHIHTVLSSQQFLLREGLGKEIPFFICPYYPSDELQMKECINKLKKELDSIKLLHIDLYDLCISLLDEENILQRIFEIEIDSPKADIKELLQSVFDSEKHLIPKIEQQIKKEHQILLISGVGEVFPYIRSHNILNNLQAKVKDKPTLMFFPGEYESSERRGTALKLFDRLGDDKYYRAFNIYDYTRDEHENE